MPGFPSRNPGPAAAAPPSGTGEEARTNTVEDALRFMLRVKSTLDRAVYLEFLNILSQRESIGLSGLAERTEVLLRGYPALLRHFNMFLPPQYKMSVTDDDQQEQAPAADNQQGRSGQRH